MQSLHTHTRARVSYNAHPDAPTGLRPMPFSRTQPPPCPTACPRPSSLPDFPLSPDYPRPAFLQGIIDCGNSPAQRDILLLGAGNRAGKHPQQTGKFCVRTKAQVSLSASIRHRASRFRQRCADLGTPFGRTHTQRAAEHLPGKNKDLPHGKDQMGHFGEGKGKYPRTQQPQLKMLLIAGDNTGTGIQENLMDSGGVGLICETEADTVSTAIGGDHGHWSDLLRNVSTMTGWPATTGVPIDEYRECNVTFLCVLLSGTPAQIKPLIPSARKRIVLSPAVLLYACH